MINQSYIVIFLIIFKIKYNLITFFYDLNIILHLSHPSNHSKILKNFTLNPPTFTFNPLKVNNTNFTLLSIWCHPLPLHPINLEWESGRKREILLFLNHLCFVLAWGWYQDYNYVRSLFFSIIMKKM